MAGTVIHDVISTDSVAFSCCICIVYGLARWPYIESSESPLRGGLEVEVGLLEHPSEALRLSWLT